MALDWLDMKAFSFVCGNRNFNQEDEEKSDFVNVKILTALQMFDGWMDLLGTFLIFFKKEKDSFLS